MNNVQILGNITREVELKYAQSGIAIGGFGIAYNERRKQQDGSYADVPHFFDCTAFGKTAENINQYFHKGSRILISGSLDFQSWNDQQGQKRSKVGIKVEQFDFIDKRDNSQQATQQNYAPQQKAAYQPPPVTYQNAQGKQVPPPQRQMPQHPPVIDIDDEQVPF
jgi:single-strand DNA-binding protein